MSPGHESAPARLLGIKCMQRLFKTIAFLSRYVLHEYIRTDHPPHLSHRRGQLFFLASVCNVSTTRHCTDPPHKSYFDAGLGWSSPPVNPFAMAELKVSQTLMSLLIRFRWRRLGKSKAGTSRDKPVLRRGGLFSGPPNISIRIPSANAALPTWQYAGPPGNEVKQNHPAGVEAVRESRTSSIEFKPSTRGSDRDHRDRHDDARLLQDSWVGGS